MPQSPYESPQTNSASTETAVARPSAAKKDWSWWLLIPVLPPIATGITAFLLYNAMLLLPTELLLGYSWLFPYTIAAAFVATCSFVWCGTAVVLAQWRKVTTGVFMTVVPVAFYLLSLIKTAMTIDIPTDYLVEVAMLAAMWGLGGGFVVWQAHRKNKRSHR